MERVSCAVAISSLRVDAVLIRTAGGGLGNAVDNPVLVVLRVNTSVTVAFGLDVGQIGVDPPPVLVPPGQPGPPPLTDTFARARAPAPPSA